MPVVNGKHFGYSAKGKKAAKKYAKKTGKKIKHKKNPGYYVESGAESVWDTYINLALILEKKKKKKKGDDWMQGAVKRPGRCTPMPNPDCPVGSPQYNLGKRFKKAARKKKKKGGTGWQGKV